MPIFLFLLWISISSVFSQSDYYYNNWCGGDLQYLDDANCIKAFPSSVDREWTCQLGAAGLTEDDCVSRGYTADAPFSAATVVDTDTLLNIVPEGLEVNICAILTLRVIQGDYSSTPKLYNKYYCLGEESVVDSYETWSSSKVYAAAQAGGELRGSTSTSTSTSGDDVCDMGNIGIDSATTGKQGRTALGDLVSIVTSYDKTKGYTSNALAAYFNTIAYRQREYSLVDTWLGDVSSSGRTVKAQSLGGDYGEPIPSDLEYSYYPLSSSSPSSSSCPVAHDSPASAGLSNTLSALSQAELTRRIVQHRELLPELRFPNSTWNDMQQILYGSGGADGTFFPAQEWGGMTADTAVFLQASITNMENIDEISAGQWRIFSKLGCGWSTYRLVGEMVSNAYGCIPSSSSSNKDGVEFTIHVRGSVPGDSSLNIVQEQVLAGMQAVVAAIQSGELN